MEGEQPRVRYGCWLWGVGRLVGKTIARVLLSKQAGNCYSLHKFAQVEGQAIGLAAEQAARQVDRRVNSSMVIATTVSVTSRSWHTTGSQSGWFLRPDLRLLLQPRSCALPWSRNLVLLVKNLPAPCLLVYLFACQQAGCGIQITCTCVVTWLIATISYVSPAARAPVVPSDGLPTCALLWTLCMVCNTSSTAECHK